jgi:UDP-3-O-[3-hydroxymyristoyl] glucosamine N-acyltransferase
MQPASTGSSRFFQKCGPHRLSAVADVAGALSSDDLNNLQDPFYDGVAPLQTAGPSQISFLDNRRYAPMLDTTRAGAVIVHPDMRSRVPAGAAAIVTREPYTAWARVAALFHPSPPVSPGIHPSSVIDPSAKVDASAEIGPFCVVGADAEIGARCRIGASATIGQGVVMGPDCRVGTHASVSHAILGARVYIYPGARIGQEGFGFAVTEAGFLTVPQLGRVLLHDDVEIGANSTVDRGSAGDTEIGAGSRLDNLVQIGRNVVMGRCCIIVAQVGISGSTILGDFV